LKLAETRYCRKSVGTRKQNELDLRSPPLMTAVHRKKLKMESGRSIPARRLSHVESDGSVAMVNVAAKDVTSRFAVAEAEVVMAPHVLKLITSRAMKKGDVFAAAQIAGILAAKNTAQLIPLCHPLPLTKVDVRCEAHGKDRVRIRCVAACNGQTGVEMEALTGAAIAALTIYDMCKAADRGIVIERLALVEKAGGKSGHYRRDPIGS
jgi:cyclic pyranopterin monophosphate synthase